MDNYTGDLSVEEELAPVPVTPERWAKQFRTRDFGNEIPDVLNGWWYRTCSGYLPHPVDEVMNIGSTRAFLFTGPEGTGKYTTAMLLASNLKDRGFSCYSLTGADFDIWKGDRMTSALQAVAVGQKEGRRSSMPQPKTRPDSPVPSLQGPCDRSLKSEVPCGSGLNWR